MIDRLVAVAAAIAFLTLLPLVALSTPSQLKRDEASGPAVHVFVLDEFGSPIAGASIGLIAGLSELNRAARSDVFGEAQIGLVPGTYRLIVRMRGYEPLTQQVEVKAETSPEIRVTLAKTLETIGKVLVHSSANVSGIRLSRGDIAAELSPDLLHALNQIDGISTGFASNGQLSSVSLGGRESSLTNFAFNGAQLTSPVATHLLDPNLLSSIDVDQASDSLNAEFLTPTLSPASSFSQTIGGFGQAVERGSASGTLGQTGLAAVAAVTQIHSALDGSTYQDSTGLTYAHGGEGSSRSAYGVVQAPIGDFTSISIRSLIRDSQVEPVPSYIDGLYPYGYGPGALEHIRANLLGISASADVNGIVLGVDVLQAGESDNINAPRAFGLLPITLSQGSSNDSLQLNLNGDDPALDNLRAHVFLATQQGESFVNPSPAGSPLGETSSAFGSLELGVDAGLRSHRLGRVTLSASDSNGLASALRFEGNWRRGPDDVGFFLGSKTQPNAVSAGGVYGTPQTATYDCSAGTVTVSAPSDAGRPVEQVGASVAWGHEGRRFQTHVYGYDFAYQNVLLNGGLVSPQATSSDEFPNGLVTALQGGFLSIGRCAGSQPSLSNIYFQKNVGGLHILNRGVDLQVTEHFGKHENVMIQTFFDLQQSTLVAAPSALEGPSSIYVIGDQLPFVPLQHAGLTMAWALGDKRTELGAVAAAYSRNNANVLPPYAEVSVGVINQRSANAQIILGFSNVTHTYVGNFSSPAFAQPLATVGGRPLLTNAALLGQPDAFARLELKL